MINNIEIIKKFLNFPSEDVFYHLQILKRKKEHPELGSNSYVVKTYYIRSLEYLERKMPEIICLCNFHNARAGINLNKRSFEKMAFQTLKKVSDQIMNKDFRSVRKAYQSVCGSFASDSEKKWIIDCDFQYNVAFIEKLDQILEICDPIGPKILGIIPTKNGFHVISKPFDKDQFRHIQTEALDIQKDNPTILYIP